MIKKVIPTMKENIFDDVIARSKGLALRREDIPGYIYYGTWEGTLSENQIGMLTAVSDFKGFAQFQPAELLDEVKVILDSQKNRKIEIPFEDLKKELDALKKEKDELSDRIKSPDLDPRLSEDIAKRIQELVGLIAVIDGMMKDGKDGKDDCGIEVELLGKYCRRADTGNNPEIHLYMDSIKDEQLLGIVFSHELMHACFDRQSDHPYCPLIEEPIAEYGMLCFMEMFERITSYKGIFNKAMKHVKGKRSSAGICHYGFGSYLFEDRFRFGADWVSLFSSYCPEIDMNSDEVKAYDSMISQVRYPSGERACESALSEILRPRRFRQISEATFYDGTAKHPKDRIEMVLNGDACKLKDFILEYCLVKGPEIRIKFKSKAGRCIEGKATVCKRRPFPSRRMNISSDQNLVNAYHKLFEKKEQFKIYEKKPAIGPNPAIWEADQL